MQSPSRIRDHEGCVLRATSANSTDKISKMEGIEVTFDFLNKLKGAWCKAAGGLDHKGGHAAFSSCC
jgi:hypothetical protein